MARLIFALLCGFLTAANAQAPARIPVEQVAEQYVRLGLALGEHDRDYVDAYYGPPAWREEMKKAQWPLVDIGARAIGLISGLQPTPEELKDEMTALRYEYLRRQLHALAYRVIMLGGRKLRFDDESRQLFGAAAPVLPDAHYDEALKDLELLLPGPGTLFERNEAFRKQFVVPADKVSAVFDAAMAECRRRTLVHAKLPEGEKLTVEYVRDKPWTAYQWYQGNFTSVIQVNVDLPMYIGSAIALACHEGYPGHHLYHALIEQHLVRGRGWVEFSLYALYSPHSLLSEGSAEYGIELAFPDDERVKFWREVLFPLAGLDPSLAERYHQVGRAFRKFSHSGVQAARRYLDGEADREATVAWLARYTLTARPYAERRTRFFDGFRSYVINYDLGRELVKRHVESRAGESPERRWAEFVKLLSSPRLLSEEK